MGFDNLWKLLLQLIGHREMYESYYQKGIVFRVELEILRDSDSCFRFNIFKSSHNHKTTTEPKQQQQTKKSPSKKPKRKYEYFTSALFVGQTERAGTSTLSATRDAAKTTKNNNNNDDDDHDSTATNSGGLACRIDPVLLDSCFAVSAGELRALRRTDDQACSKLTTEGGTRLREAFFSRRSWRATLCRTPEEIFAPAPAAGDDRRNETSRGGSNDNDDQAGGLLPLADLDNPFLLLERDDDDDDATVRASPK